MPQSGAVRFHTLDVVRLKSAKFFEDFLSLEVQKNIYIYMSLNFGCDVNSAKVRNFIGGSFVQLENLYLFICLILNGYNTTEQWKF